MLKIFNYKRIIAIVAILVVVLSSFTTLVYASVANPDSIASYSNKAFENIFATGDMIFISRYNIGYTTEPSESADTTFYYSLYSENGTTLILSRPINYYEHNLISLYVSAEQVTSLGLVYGSSYRIRISGSPAFFPTLTEGVNMITRTLSSSDWNTDGALTSKQLLYSYCIDIASELEADWVITLLSTTSTGTQVLNAAGTVVFLAAIPNLTNALPSLFYLSSSSAIINSNSANLTMEDETVLSTKLGTSVSNAFAGIGDFLGITETTSAGLWILLFTLSVASIIFLATGNSTGSMVLSVPIIIMGAYLGAIPLTILFTVGLLIIAYVFYFIWLRGT